MSGAGTPGGEVLSRSATLRRAAAAAVLRRVPTLRTTGASWSVLADAGGASTLLPCERSDRSDKLRTGTPGNGTANTAAFLGVTGSGAALCCTGLLCLEPPAWLLPSLHSGMPGGGGSLLSSLASAATRALVRMRNVALGAAAPASADGSAAETPTGCETCRGAGASALATNKSSTAPAEACLGSTPSAEVASTADASTGC
mmetsp:Transcript_144649/g.403072  ORF Transcript_144649/g.403072 Transcript_144649/m.403072 type:complete len:201 (-) Transcript_144649:178-780(-)